MSSSPSSDRDTIRQMSDQIGTLVAKYEGLRRAAIEVVDEFGDWDANGRHVLVNRVNTLCSALASS